MRNFIATSVLLVGALFVANAPQARADLFGPDNYDECILESMKGVTSDVAARLIHRSCRNKFPKESTGQWKEVDCDVKLSASEIKSLEITSIRSESETYVYSYIDIYNKTGRLLAHITFNINERLLDAEPSLQAPNSLETWKVRVPEPASEGQTMAVSSAFACPE